MVAISVIIPFYNSKETAVKSIDSVLAEVENSGLSYELICVDDGSTDGTSSLLDEVAAKNNSDSTRLGKIVVLHILNGGAAAARNAGLKKASGELIAFNDSDDCWLKGSLQRRLDILNADSDVCCVTGNHCVEKQRIPHLAEFNGFNNAYVVTFANEMFKNYYTTQNSIIRRKVIDDGIFFKDGMRYSEEVYFFCQIVKKYKCVFYNEKLSESVLGKERFGDSGLSGNLKLMEKGELKSFALARKELGVNIFLYFAAVVFSLVKYLRRIIVVRLRKARAK